jgi:hypothetical protein
MNAHPVKEAPLDTLSPREIQSRLRSGATVAELAEESGMDAVAIERFSGPPLAERAFISQQARNCVVRPGNDDLETLVVRHLDNSAREDLVWDSWRRLDGRWTVVASVGDAAPLSTWVYDARSRSLQPDDASSHRLASEDVVVPLRSTTVALPREEPAAPTAEVTPAPAPATDDEVASPAEAIDETPAPTRSKSRKSRRASVPRWDEILFGAGQSES